MYYQREHSWAKEAEKYNVKGPGHSQTSHNRGRKRELVAQGRAHGIIVFSGDRPVGWCAYGAKEEFPAIDRGRFYRKLDLKDDGKLWRIACLFVDSKYRRKGVSKFALQAALASISRKGGGTVEAYPRTSKRGGSSSLWFGTIGMFEGEGFKTVAPLGVSALVRKTVPALKTGSRKSGP